MESFNDKWSPDESDELYESDEEYIQNEVLPPELDEEFRKDVLEVKHNLYDGIILAPNLGTSEAQSNETIIKYLKNINQVYMLCLNAQRGIIKEEDLIKFPENVRGSLQRVLNWLHKYFKKNSMSDTIPYEDYIRKSFHDYQFVQNNSFE